jgi:pilus assembly protein TadC
MLTLYVASQPTGIFYPHVLGVLALAEFIVLLPGIGFKVE